MSSVIHPIVSRCTAASVAPPVSGAVGQLMPATMRSCASRKFPRAQAKIVGVQREIRSPDDGTDTMRPSNHGAPNGEPTFANDALPFLTPLGLLLWREGRFRPACHRAIRGIYNIPNGPFGRRTQGPSAGFVGCAEGMSLTYGGETAVPDRCRPCGRCLPPP